MAGTIRSITPKACVLLHIQPDGVRRPLPAGTPLDPRDHPDLFRKDLSAVAPSGAAGVPSAADGSRGDRYLDAVVNFIVEAVRRSGPVPTRPGLQPGRPPRKRGGVAKS